MFRITCWFAGSDSSISIGSDSSISIGSDSSISIGSDGSISIGKIRCNFFFLLLY